MDAVLVILQLIGLAVGIIAAAAAVWFAMRSRDALREARNSLASAKLSEDRAYAAAQCAHRAATEAEKR